MIYEDNLRDYRDVDSLSLLEFDNSSKGEISIFGVPTGFGAGRSAGNVTGRAPCYLRERGLQKMLRHIGFDIFDKGNFKIEEKDFDSSKVFNGVRNIVEVVKVSEDLGKEVFSEINLGRKILAIGGDHSMSIGSILGASSALKGNIGLIWIDAHADLNGSVDLENPENIDASPTGNAHGMPVRVLTGLHSHVCFRGLVDKFQGIDPKNVLFIGLKDLDLGEISLLRSEGFNFVTIDDINITGGVQKVIDKIIKLRSRVGSVWVDLDIDALDETIAPATPMPNKSGITGHHIRTIFKFLGKYFNTSDTRVIGMGVAELMPSLDADGKTADLVLELVASAFGGRYTEFDRYLDNPEG